MDNGDLNNVENPDDVFKASLTDVKYQDIGLPHLDDYSCRGRQPPENLSYGDLI